MVAMVATMVLKGRQIGILINPHFALTTTQKQEDKVKMVKIALMGVLSSHFLKISINITWRFLAGSSTYWKVVEMRKTWKGNEFVTIKYLKMYEIDTHIAEYIMPSSHLWFAPIWLNLPPAKWLPNDARATVWKKTPTITVIRTYKKLWSNWQKRAKIIKEDKNSSKRNKTMPMYLLLLSSE